MHPVDNSREQDKGKGHRQRLRDKFAIRGIDALNDEGALRVCHKNLAFT